MTTLICNLWKTLKGLKIVFIAILHLLQGKYFKNNSDKKLLRCPDSNNLENWISDWISNVQYIFTFYAY